MKKRPNENYRMQYLPCSRRREETLNCGRKQRRAAAVQNLSDTSTLPNGPSVLKCGGPLALFR
jgi:hypothetical protein